MSLRSTICIFAKPPRAGEVKTRLAVVSHPTLAACVAQALLEDTIAAAEQVREARVVLSVTEPFDLPCFRHVSQWLQPEGDLGIRLEATLHRALLDAPYAIALGADTPGLPSRVIEAAIEQLASCDTVLGPTDDGGYYLLALKRCPGGLLKGIRWSQPHALADTIQKLKISGHSYALAEQWFDLDTGDDLARVRSLLDQGKLSAPRLSAAISRCSPAAEVSP